MHNRMLPLFVAAAACSVVGSALADNFSALKKEMSSAPCTRLNFVSVLESEVFDRVDSTEGKLILLHDGRYRLDLGADQYLYNGSRLYSYSAGNNQVTVEKVAQNASFEGQISFVTRLDEFYKTVTLRPDSAYRLLKKPERNENIPDSLVVFLSKVKGRLAEIQYFDENGDQNRIIFRNQEIGAPCDKKEFEPDFPDSAEVVELN